mgnify:CR=1 FL=1
MGPGTRAARAGILIALAMLLTVTSTSLMVNAQDVCLLYTSDAADE